MNEQELWEAIFIALLVGEADGEWTDARPDFIVNRAERLADVAVARVLQRRKFAIARAELEKAP